jgi:mRNA-degrading endonuclease RelE of RelBE toxin-antitoxin system/PHD/YefM family antitoxin component YafN of YafNO toxin-antitoxin module
MPSRKISAHEAQANFMDLISRLGPGGESLVIDVPGTRGLAILPAELLEAYEETIEILSDPTLLERVRAGDFALQSGSFIAQKDFETEFGMDVAKTGTRPWRLVVSNTARTALRSLPRETSRAQVIEFVAGPLLDNPTHVGVELAADLARHFSAHIVDQRVVYRLDTTQKIVRLIDVHLWEHRYLTR